MFWWQLRPWGNTNIYSGCQSYRPWLTQIDCMFGSFERLWPTVLRTVLVAQAPVRLSKRAGSHEEDELETAKCQDLDRAIIETSSQAARRLIRVASVLNALVPFSRLFGPCNSRPLPVT